MYDAGFKKVYKIRVFIAIPNPPIEALYVLLLFCISPIPNLEYGESKLICADRFNENITNKNLLMLFLLVYFFHKNLK